MTTDQNEGNTGDVVEASELPEPGGDPIRNDTPPESATATLAAEQARTARRETGVGTGVVSGMRYGADGYPLPGELPGDERRGEGGGRREEKEDNSPSAQAAKKAAEVQRQADQARREAQVAQRQELRARQAEAIDRTPVSAQAETNEGAFAVAKWGDATKGELEEQIRSWKTASQTQIVATNWVPVQLPEDHGLSREELLKYLVMLHDSPDVIKPTFQEFLEEVGRGDEAEDFQSNEERMAEIRSLGASIQSNPPAAYASSEGGTAPASVEGEGGGDDGEPADLGLGGSDN